MLKMFIDYTIFDNCNFLRVNLQGSCVDNCKFKLMIVLNTKLPFEK